VLGVHRYSEFISSTLVRVLTCDSKRASPWSVITQAMLSDLFHNKCTGGANEAVIRMLVSIGSMGGIVFFGSVDMVSDSPSNVPAFLEAVKRREKVLSGFGHR
jgi:citrate synthase